MLWREEQRAIGELMRQTDDEFRCIGFSSFADNYKDRFSRWFDTFASQLQNKSASNAYRLGELQRVLDGLLVSSMLMGNSCSSVGARELQSHGGLSRPTS
jgi:hypothetical protein